MGKGTARKMGSIKGAVEIEGQQCYRRFTKKVFRKLQNAAVFTKNTTFREGKEKKNKKKKKKKKKRKKKKKKKKKTATGRVRSVQGRKRKKGQSTRRGKLYFEKSKRRNSRGGQQKERLTNEHRWASVTGRSSLQK